MLYLARWKKITVDESKVLKNRLFRFFWATRYTSANGIAAIRNWCVACITIWIQVSICYPSISISYYACTMTFLERWQIFYVMRMWKRWKHSDKYSFQCKRGINFKRKVQCLEFVPGLWFLFSVCVTLPTCINAIIFYPFPVVFSMPLSVFYNRNAIFVH